MKARRQEGREAGKEGGREGGREGWREGGRVGGREGEREGGREGGGRGELDREMYYIYSITRHSCLRTMPYLTTPACMYRDINIHGE